MTTVHRARAVTPDDLSIDAERTVAEICGWMRSTILRRLGRRGAVVGLSGGVDSSVTAALCARSLGPDRVLAVFTPESDSDRDSLELGRLVADGLGIAGVTEDITPVLRAVGCYERRTRALATIIPGLDDDWRFKLVLPSVADSGRLPLVHVVARSPSGEEVRARLPAPVLLEVIAATSFKQRTRKMIEYFHADRRKYAVVGTPNRLEHDQGFFVKQGDGSADLKPIAHLYKSQVYALADHLGVPEVIRTRPPTTDTYSLPQTQEEFFFSLPYDKLDLCLYARDEGLPPECVADAVGLDPSAVQAVFDDIDRKRRAADYLHASPLHLLAPDAGGR